MEAQSIKASVTKISTASIRFVIVRTLDQVRDEDDEGCARHKQQLSKHRPG